MEGYMGVDFEPLSSKQIKTISGKVSAFVCPSQPPNLLWSFYLIMLAESALYYVSLDLSELHIY